MYINTVQQVQRAGLSRLTFVRDKEQVLLSCTGPVYVKRSQYTAVCDSVRSKQEDILQYVCDIDIDNANILD